VAELTQRKLGGEFVFKYLPSFKELRLSPIPGFPEFEKEYVSSELWPYFLERIPDKRRPEIKALIEQRGLQNASELRLLAELGSMSITDPFTIQPKVA
jgi:hypothetical protein